MTVTRPVNSQPLLFPRVELPGDQQAASLRNGLTVTVCEHHCRQRVNPGFQNPQRPAWYLATQEIIVPKEPLFASLCEMLIRKYRGRRERLVVFEPGIGLGLFFQYLLEKTRLPEMFELRLIGADVAHEMLLAGRDLLAAVEKRSSWRPVTVELHSRVNLLEWHSPDVQLALQDTPWDVVIASQFEHYYANDPSSPLAQKLSRLGFPVATKHQFRQFVFDHLQSGGCYFSLDDYLSGNTAEDGAQLQAWDSYVARALSDPARTGELARSFPAIAAVLARKYDPALGFDRLLQKVIRARERRRALCHEETAEINSAISDLGGIFGGKHVTVLSHPLASSHGHFRLVCAERSDANEDRNFATATAAG